MWRLSVPFRWYAYQWRDQGCLGKMVLAGIAVLMVLLLMSFMTWAVQGTGVSWVKWMVPY